MIFIKNLRYQKLKKNLNDDLFANEIFKELLKKLTKYGREKKVAKVYLDRPLYTSFFLYYFYVWLFYYWARLLHDFVYQGFEQT